MKEGFILKTFNYLFFNKIDGDYLEFGEHRGRTFARPLILVKSTIIFGVLHISKGLENMFSTMRFFAFDHQDCLTVSC
jgi:hypothetical protein